MPEMNFGRQLKPVTVIIEGELADRDHWFNTIRNCLRHQACDLSGAVHKGAEQIAFNIYPNANND